MAAIKAYTDISQSKKLAKILPIESADMNYWRGTQIRIGGYRTMDKDLDIPCWSLAALLDILSKTAHSIDEDGSVDLCDWDIDNVARLWTIQDAENGDVLVSQYGKPFIYNGNHDSSTVGSYCGITVESRFDVATEKCRWTENVNIHPTTQEQRDALMKAMADVGYTFDFKKKELKRIEEKPYLE